MKWPQGLRISRMSGAENTFFVINTFDAKWSGIFKGMKEADKIALASHLCRDFYGFHTDGILFLRPEDGYDFAWDFYNSDGSKAEMCGNAARCATLFYHRHISPKDEMKFLTGAGEISGEVLSDRQVRVRMTEISEGQNMTVLGNEGYFVNTGVPHFVFPQIPDADLARSLRRVNDFGPAGANITFVQGHASDYIECVTFERGVENFTRACGTGAVAAAMYLQSIQGHREVVQVRMPGGLLIVEGAKAGARPFLSGPTQLDFDIENWEMKS